MLLKPLSEEHILASGSDTAETSPEIRTPDEQRVVDDSMGDIQLDLRKLDAHFVAEPVGGKWNPEDDRRHYLLVSEAAAGKDSPLQSATVLALVIARKIASLRALLGDAPDAEALVAPLEAAILLAQERLETAQKVTWWQERLSAFSYGGVYNPTLDELRPNRD